VDRPTRTAEDATPEGRRCVLRPRGLGSRSFATRAIACPCGVEEAGWWTGGAAQAQEGEARPGRRGGALFALASGGNREALGAHLPGNERRLRQLGIDRRVRTPRRARTRRSELTSRPKRADARSLSRAVEGLPRRYHISLCRSSRVEKYAGGGPQPLSASPLIEEKRGPVKAADFRLRHYHGASIRRRIPPIFSRSNSSCLRAHVWEVVDGTTADGEGKTAYGWVEEYRCLTFRPDRRLSEEMARARDSRPSPTGGSRPDPGAGPHHQRQITPGTRSKRGRGPGRGTAGSSCAP